MFNLRKAADALTAPFPDNETVASLSLRFGVCLFEDGSREKY